MRIALERYGVEGRVPAPAEEVNAVLEKERLWQRRDEDLGECKEQEINRTLVQSHNPFAPAVLCMPLASALRPFVPSKNPNPPRMQQEQNAKLENMYEKKGHTERYVPPAFTMNDLLDTLGLNYSKPQESTGTIAPKLQAEKENLPRLVGRLLRALPRTLEMQDRAPDPGYVVTLLCRVELAACPTATYGKREKEDDMGASSAHPAKKKCIQGSDQLMRRLNN